MITSGWSWLLVLSPIITLAAYWFVFVREPRRTLRPRRSLGHQRGRVRER